MLETIYLGLIGVSLLVNVVLTVYLLARKMKNLATAYYILFMLGIVIHVFGDLMFQLSGADKWAIVWIFLYWIGYFVMGAFFFLFTTEYPRKKLIFFNNEIAKLSILILPAAMVYLLFFSRDFVKEIVIVTDGINYVNYGTVYGLAIGYLLMFLGIGLIIVLSEYLKTQPDVEKANLKMIFIGVFIGAFFGIIGDVYLLEMFGFGEAKLASLFILVGATIITYAVVNYKIFDIKHESEEEITTKPIFSTEEGKNYFVHEKKFPSKAIRYFADQVRHKRQGLVISTIYPKQINQRYGLKHTPIIWLSDVKEKGLQSVSPKDIDLLYRTVVLFLDRAKKPVLLVEGLKELVLYNGTSKTIEFINTLTSKTSEKGANVFFSLTKTEPKFIDLANEIKSLEENLNKLEKKFLVHHITEDTYIEILEENEQKLARAKSELKVIEDEMTKRIVGLSEDEYELLVLKTMISRINYKINKRQIRTSSGVKILKETQKKIDEFERRVNKKSRSIENGNRY